MLSALACGLIVCLFLVPGHGKLSAGLTDTRIRVDLAANLHQRTNALDDGLDPWLLCL